MEDQKTTKILQLSNGRPGRRCPLGSAENSFWQLWSRNRHGGMALELTFSVFSTLLLLVLFALGFGVQRE